MNTREDLAGLVDAMGAAGTYGIELAAPGTIDARKAEDVHGDAMRPAHLLPAAFRIEAPPRAGTARTGLAPFVHPGAAARTVDAGGRHARKRVAQRTRVADMMDLGSPRILQIKTAPHYPD